MFVPALGTYNNCPLTVLVPQFNSVDSQSDHFYPHYSYSNRVLLVKLSPGTL